MVVKWYFDGMRTTMDKAGRIIIPKELRDYLGFVPGEVELTADGAALRVEPVGYGQIVEEDGHFFIAAVEGAEPPSDEQIRKWRTEYRDY